MKRRQYRRLGVEPLESRQLLSSFADAPPVESVLHFDSFESFRTLSSGHVGYTYDSLGNLLSTTDDTNVAETRDADGDLDIYVTNGPGSRFDGGTRLGSFTIDDIDDF